MSKQQMPDTIELEDRFSTFITSIDLPPDKADILKNIDCETKWKIICTQELVQIKNPPSYYLNILRMYLDPNSYENNKVRCINGKGVKHVLVNLEISLRTNPIEWMNTFLDENNMGLDVLIEYLHFLLEKMRYDLNSNELNSESDMINNTLNRAYFRYICSACSPTVKTITRNISEVKMGDLMEEIHDCLMCIRPIVKNMNGCNMVIKHKDAINCISISLIHRSLDTKALVLKLLTAICFNKVGHDKIISAFDNFTNVLNERCRFETLMEYFANTEPFHLDFMVSWIQFVNNIVHSINDMNLRIQLQSEFTALNLSDYVERLRGIENDDLQVHISRYLNNVHFVNTLIHENKTKLAVTEKMDRLQEKLRQANEKLKIFEQDIFTQICSDFTKRNLNIVDLQPLFDEIRDKPDTYEDEAMKKMQKQSEETLARIKEVFELSTIVDNPKDSCEKSGIFNRVNKELLPPSSPQAMLSSSAPTLWSRMDPSPPPIHKVRKSIPYNMSGFAMSLTSCIDIVDLPSFPMMTRWTTCRSIASEEFDSNLAYIQNIDS